MPAGLYLGGGLAIHHLAIERPLVEICAPGCSSHTAPVLAVFIASDTPHTAVPLATDERANLAVADLLQALPPQAISAVIGGASRIHTSVAEDQQAAVRCGKSSSLPRSALLRS